jgi:FtsP/CotA-like multicopper oxidase with cupredoxin domain
MSRCIPLLVLTLLTGSAASRGVEPVRPNDNRQAAGTLLGGVLTVQLEARRAVWHPAGDDAPGAEVPVFAEAGKAAQIPGPLIRAAAGTRVSASVRNSLPNDTLLVHGLYTREAGAKEGPAIQILPGETRTVEFLLGAPGSYYYWATTMRRGFRFRFRDDAQLTGAIVIDRPGTPPAPDRILVITMWADTMGGVMPHGRHRLLAAINGRSWPATERLTYTVGDTVRWRVINGSIDLHPMHLHGFYFRIDARGNEVADSSFTDDDRVRAVTELLQYGETMRLTWVAERDGNWAFHCHIPEHIEARGPLGELRRDGAHTAHDASSGMSGLVMAIHVSPRAGQPSTADRAPPGRHRFRLVVDPLPNDTSVAALRFALADGATAPVRDPASHLGPPIVVQLGEPVSVTVVNRSAHATTVHWHGIELESYFDGIGGLSGTSGKLAPVIAPKDSFEARFTPPRAGTFIYHSHVDEGSQQPAGLIGPIIVLPPGTRYDPKTDLTIVFSSPVDSADEARAVLINGRLDPAPLELHVGTTYRLRLVNITTARPGFKVELRRDSAVVPWHPLARDGADLPESRRTPRPGTVSLTIGQTMDFAITPTALGDLTIGTVANAGFSLGSLSLRVVP